VQLSHVMMINIKWDTTINQSVTV